MGVPLIAVTPRSTSALARRRPGMAMCSCCRDERRLLRVSGDALRGDTPSDSIDVADTAEEVDASRREGTGFSRMGDPLSCGASRRESDGGMDMGCDAGGCGGVESTSAVSPGKPGGEDERVVGESAAGEGSQREGSGARKPFSHFLLVKGAGDFGDAQVIDSLELSRVGLRAVGSTSSFIVVRQEVDPVGLAEGDRRGEGRGKSWSSSSSGIGDARGIEGLRPTVLTPRHGGSLGEPGLRDRCGDSSFRLMMHSRPLW